LSGAGITLVADLSGLVVRFRGLDDVLADALASEWAPFIASASRTPWLDVEVQPSDRTIAIGRVMRPSLTGDVKDGAARFWSDEGEITIDAAGIARLSLGRGDDNWRFWGLVNLIAAVLAVRLPSRPGALLHAAGIVLDDRAFLLIGPEGSGKSTFAQAAREGGAQVISDDTVLVDKGPDGLVLLGSPIRAHEATNPGPGRWPIAAGLHARRGNEARLDPVGRLAVETLLAANLPFLASGWGRDARLDALVPFLAGAAPYRVLTFPPDPSFLGVLRSFRIRN
jgi:hypothetical protein